MNAHLLADGRFPSGGHAHSGGLEAAADDGRVHDLDTLASFLLGRLVTAGLAAASLAAAACSGRHPWAALDEECDVRIASPALRRASRHQGRQLLRAALAVWPHEGLRQLSWRTVGLGPHHPVVLGAASLAAGLSPDEAAGNAAYGSVAAPASAAVRLLSFDPFDVTMVLAGLAPEMEEVVQQAVVAADAPLRSLPCPAAPLLDIGAEHHAGSEARLFAS